MSPDPNHELERAREAARRGSWSEAYRRFQAVDLDGLAPDDLEAAADASFWTRHMDEFASIRQRAYAAFAAAGDAPRAAHSAWLLAVDADYTGEPSAASGWIKRAARHLDDLPERFEHGLVWLYHSNKARERGDLAEARRLAERIIDLGRRLGSPDLEAAGIETLGRVVIAEGNVAEGMQHLDEAMISVLAEELSPMFTGIIYCDVLGSCMQVADVGRAGEWTKAAMEWCRSHPDNGPWQGACRLFRVEVGRLLGEWSEAEAEARQAAEELRVAAPGMAAEATYWSGELHRLRGDYAAAEGSFQRTQELGRDPQPGLALVRLAKGKTEAAAAGLRIALTAEGGGLLHRARLLAAQVEVGLAGGEIATACSAVAELEAIAEASASAALKATADASSGAVALAEGRVEAAVRCLRRAWEAWRDLRLPYEAARTRMLIGVACRRAGDEEGARLEMEAARAAFEQLGAQPDARAAADLLQAASDLPRGLSAREVEVLRLVAAGKTNREIAAELILSEHTVSRHLQNIFRKLGVSSRSAATAFAFENSLV